MKKTKVDKGITMIALTVTVIVLLILAGVSVSMLKGDDGVLQQASGAKTAYEVAEEKEILAQAGMQAANKNKYGEIDAVELEKEIEKIIGENKVNVTPENDLIEVGFIDSRRTYTIDSNGNISEGGV